ncbi:helix-turn-helix domain-containing protein [Flavobacterium sp. LHD-85]|uniref:helix-turn-helix domain-containing protein n=1 Tax=Flavobacterium sp. LHD-85 TaxID=3071410 RepID=UPI0027DF3675|nr:helix-turn-helix domain-containing protein [Flavobacterium sp. LHD-85]MDQ6532097.1 helix-turn-helix domain-containing protein [Flavobacterium sp. LHD-85]
MKDTILLLSFFIAAIAGLALSFVILLSKKKYEASFFLGLFLLSLSFVSIYNFHLASATIKEFSDILIIARSFIFLAAPCAFLYIRSVLSANLKYKKYDWLHFLPFILYFSLSTMMWLDSFFSLNILRPLPFRFYNPLSFLSLTMWLLYALLQTVMILNYDWQKFTEKEINKIKALTWIRVYNLITLFLFSTLFVLYFLNTHDNISFSSYCLISLALLFTCTWLYFQPQVFYDTGLHLNTNEFYLIDDDQKVLETEFKTKNTPFIRESNFESEKKYLYLARLENIFSKKKRFLRKDLTIRDVASEIGLSVNQLSNLINSELNASFHDYVNLKRIEYFKEKINSSKWEGLSLEGMAWASGFKSRTTCFRAFIKHTGKSPSEYFKLIRVKPQKRNPNYNYSK